MALDPADEAQGADLILATLALAHSPHDVCSAAGRADDGGLLVGQGDDLARYAGDGTLVAHLPSPGGSPVCIAPLGAGWVLVTDQAAWRSEDQGATWGQLPLSGASACAVASDSVLVGGEDGIWRVPVDGSIEAVDETPVIAVAEGPDGVLALDTAGALLGPSGLLHAGPWTVLAGGVDVLLGDALGVVAWEDGALRPTTDGPTELRALATGSAWLAAGSTGGVWVSHDAGLSWTEQGEGLEEQESGSGSPDDGVHWAALNADDPWLAASWEGLYAWDSRRWVQRELRTVPLVRSLQWLEDGILLIAPYGAGIARGTPGGDDWVDAAPSLDWPWLRTVVATEHGEGRWWAVGGKHLYASDDQGANWDVTLTELQLTGDVVAVAPGWPADARVWAGGVAEGGGAVLASSPDGGTTWMLTPLSDCRDKPNALAVGSGVRIACQGAVYDEDGAEVDLPPELVGSVTVLEPSGDAWMMGGEGGFWRIDTADTLLVDTNIRGAVADGDDWILATDAGLVRLHGSDSSPLGWPTDDLVESLAARDGRLAAGLYSGAWTSEDAGVTWTLATDLDRYDDSDRTWWYAGWTRVDDEGAKVGTAMAGDAGAVAEWRLEATALTVIGRGEGTLELVLDGVADTVEVSGRAWHVIWSAALEPGLHELRLEVADGHVALDGGQRWRTPGALPPEVDRPALDGPAEGCGCSGGTSAIFPFLAFWARGWRRRR